MDFLFQSLVPIVAFLTLLIITITYMAGRIFRIPGWEAYFNVELYNLIIAILIVSCAFGFFEASKQISKSLLCSNQPANCLEPVEASQVFLNNIINRGVLPMYKDLLVMEAGTAFTSSFMLKTGPAPWAFAHKVEPGTDAVLSMVRTMSFGLMVIYGSLTMQYIGMDLISFAMPIILSLGLILFIFPPTRDAGAFLIAFAFSFQTIFPFTYALNQIVLNDMARVQMHASPEDQYIMYSVRSNPVLVSVAEYGNFLVFKPYILAMARLALVSLFLPAFSLTLTIAFINAITKFLMWKI
ncbi:MAG: hypothetical protein AB1391_02390 [Candidatus Micrarchaeota archaeon]